MLFVCAIFYRIQCFADKPTRWDVGMEAAKLRTADVMYGQVRGAVVEKPLRGKDERGRALDYYVCVKVCT